MNIFVTSPLAEYSAEFLRYDKKRRGKMILESAQMLCSALSEYVEVPYKRCHYNHPCSVWVRSSRCNALWLVRYCEALERIRLEQGDNPHKSMQVINLLKDSIDYLPDEFLTPFANCTPYKEMEVHTAYKLTLLDKLLINL